jgi:cation diffusion facilitator family transporter
MIRGGLRRAVQAVSPPPTLEEAVREKRLAAIASVGSALILVALKVFLTVATGSLGVLSEALHSSLDLVAAVITWLSVSVSDLPPDSSHTYGHAKIESFSAFVETLLLLLTAIYIIYEATHRLLFHEIHLRPNAVAFVILLVCLAVDVVRSRALIRVARRYQSEALEADALHFSTDVWSTSVVILGLAAVTVGERYGLDWLQYADPIAALMVAAVIIRVGSQLGRRTLDALLDTAPIGLQQRISAGVNNLDGVLAAERVRVRRVGRRHFVDVTISVPRTATFEQVHAISDAVEKRVAEIVPADVMVHMEPRARANEGVFDLIRAIAQRRGQAIHEISANQLSGRLYVELHLEVDESLTLSAAHRSASELERDILAEVPEAAEVYIHIEPLGTHIASADTMQDLGSAVQKYINTLRSEFHELVDCHQVQVRRVERKILVSCHCTMQGQLPITEVHDVTAALEDRVREHFPQIARVTIHPEPPGEN